MTTNGECTPARWPQLCRTHNGWSSHPKQTSRRLWPTTPEQHNQQLQDHHTHHQSHGMHSLMHMCATSTAKGRGLQRPLAQWSRAENMPQFCVCAELGYVRSPPLFSTSQPRRLLHRAHQEPTCGFPHQQKIKAKAQSGCHNQLRQPYAARATSHLWVGSALLIHEEEQLEVFVLEDFWSKPLNAPPRLRHPSFPAASDPLCTRGQPSFLSTLGPRIASPRLWCRSAPV